MSNTKFKCLKYKYKRGCSLNFYSNLLIYMIFNFITYGEESSSMILKDQDDQSPFTCVKHAKQVKGGRAFVCDHSCHLDFFNISMNVLLTCMSFYINYIYLLF